MDTKRSTKLAMLRPEESPDRPCFLKVISEEEFIQYAKEQGRSDEVIAKLIATAPVGAFCEMDQPIPGARCEASGGAREIGDGEMRDDGPEWWCVWCDLPCGYSGKAVQRMEFEASHAADRHPERIADVIDSYERHWRAMRPHMVEYNNRLMLRIVQDLRAKYVSGPDAEVQS